MKLEKALLDFDSNQEKRLSHLRTQLEQQQDDMIGKINLLWKTVFEKLIDVSTPKNAGNSMALESIIAISHDEREELRKKGIKSPSKLSRPQNISSLIYSHFLRPSRLPLTSSRLSYSTLSTLPLESRYSSLLSPPLVSLVSLSLSSRIILSASLYYSLPRSIKELNKNPSAPEHVYFINSTVILSTDSDTEEENISSTNAHEHNLDSVVRRKEEVKEQGKEEDEMETDEEIEEVFEDEEIEMETEEEVKEMFDDETEDDKDNDTKYYNSTPAIKELVYHEWLLKNPRPSWVKAKIRIETPGNIKISCMIGHILMKHAYIDIESPINIMYRN
ncbi:hypothetical protein Tco_0575212 [Tanacetum coccineum]